ncbi:alpha/beta hydrolase [Lachnospiraceae bacterium OttesenSCG-928-E19]|nr:alpha/beta hydrolase [Lachnospiraceae bacterium OttesenSCG-928-E19]
MKNAIIIHGIDDSREDVLSYKDSMSNAHWLPWLQRELIKNDILTQTPEMPTPWHPDMDYNEWERVFEQFEITTDTLLIGHSCGAGFLMKYLSKHLHKKIGRLILVAPWMDIEQEHPTFFADFELGPDLVNSAKQIDQLYSTDDDQSILDTVNQIKQIYGDKINTYEFSDKRHFTEGHLKSNQFPELLEIILKK